jgi:hypothetical protein
MRLSDALPVCRSQRIPDKEILPLAPVLIKPALLSYQ